MTRMQALNELRIGPGINEDVSEEYNDAVNIAIEELEQTTWIPVSERLPERDVDVLTYHRNGSFDYQYVSWIDDYSGEWAGFIGNLSDEVLAWMPLPKPYEPQESEVEE